MKPEQIGRELGSLYDGEICSNCDGPIIGRDKVVDSGLRGIRHASLKRCEEETRKRREYEADLFADMWDDGL